MLFFDVLQLLVDVALRTLFSGICNLLSSGICKSPRLWLTDFQSVRVVDPQLLPLWIVNPQGRSDVIVPVIVNYVPAFSKKRVEN